MTGLGGVIIALISVLHGPPVALDHWNTIAHYSYRKGTVQRYEGGGADGWIVSAPKLGILRKEQRLARRGLLQRLVDGEEGWQSDAVRIGRHLLGSFRHKKVVLLVRDLRVASTVVPGPKRRASQPQPLAKALTIEALLDFGGRTIALKGVNSPAAGPGALGRGADWRFSLPGGALLVLRFDRDSGEVARAKVLAPSQRS